MYFDYQKLLSDANREVVRKILLQVQKHGLRFDHHFYISFRTDDPLVKLSANLKKQYPEEITIVIQHQFENLQVESDKFTVNLSFGGISQKIEVPFRALTNFADPSADFVLQFNYAPELDLIVNNHLHIVKPKLNGSQREDNIHDKKAKIFVDKKLVETLEEKAPNNIVVLNNFRGKE